MNENEIILYRVGLTNDARIVITLGSGLTEGVSYFGDVESTKAFIRVLQTTVAMAENSIRKQNHKRGE